MEELVRIVGVPAVILLLILREIRESTIRKKERSLTAKEFHEWKEELREDAFAQSRQRDALSGIAGRVEAVVQSIARQQGREMRMIEDLHHWHEAEDENGVKRWYIPKSMVALLEAQSREVHEQRDLLQEIQRLVGEG